MNQNISILINKAARLAGQRIAAGREKALLDLPAGLSPEVSLLHAWQCVGLTGLPAKVSCATPADLPLVVWSDGWLLVVGQQADGCWRAEDMAGESLLLDKLGAAWSLPARMTAVAMKPSAWTLVCQALLQHKRILLEAVLATGLVNLLSLAASLYSMQVYDRVIPNQGYQTLWVLTVGVVLAVLLESIIKQVRCNTLDGVCNAVDKQLSEWFFQRMMTIRMEARPASVGTLAAQIKGFEMVRGVLASTSLFVLADVPFALLFLLVITLIAGWTVVVPIIALPLALIAGLMFQRAIVRHTRNNLSANNLKAGLLVEAVDGAESLKANSAEWSVQARWNRLVEQTVESDQQIRHYSSLAQNMTVGLQHCCYIGLVALGAYFVSINELTMGGLLACTIICNRAMMPIVQLPGVMVQWAHARAAMEGLDQILSLPNEQDEQAHALLPQTLEPNIRFERVRFSYAGRPALELERLEIRPGERIGLLGAIGSGKSTLLKLASGLYRANEGKVYLGGMEQALLAPAVVRETLGYLPQDARLFSGTLRDNLLMGLPDPGDEAILQAAQRTGLLELIGGQAKGLALAISEGGRGVSGGQKQLIMLTRTLLAAPKIWLLDEPTGAMDSVTEARMVQLLAEEARNGATLVAATHKTALLPLFDRLIVLQSGRIVLDGPRDAVLAKLSGKN